MSEFGSKLRLADVSYSAAVRGEADILSTNQK
jgi:hypothetical protein